MSRKVVGSSSSSRSVSCASAMAIQTRWRWPPESSSSARPREIGDIGQPPAPSPTAAIVVARPAAEPALMRIAAAADEVGDDDATPAPSASAASRPICLRHVARRHLVDDSCRRAAQCRRSAPASRARPRSSVDLPQALAPTITREFVRRDRRRSDRGRSCGRHSRDGGRRRADALACAVSGLKASRVMRSSRSGWPR